MRDHFILKFILHCDIISNKFYIATELFAPLLFPKSESKNLLKRCNI